MPGAHHVEARTFKDLFPRFKTMQGFHVPRKGGWDCHGLPVEVAVEKELGLTGKRDIEAYGVAEFNARCRESVLRYVDAWLEMSRRMGYWADTDNAYRTMDPSYIESVWWSLKNIFDAGAAGRATTGSARTARGAARRCPTTRWASRVSTRPCPTRLSRSGSALRTLPEAAPRELEGADLLVWTTTPWTLVSNTAVAVHPDATYVVAAQRPTMATAWWSPRPWSPGCSARAGRSSPGSAGQSTGRGDVTSPRSASSKSLTPTSWCPGHS